MKNIESEINKMEFNFANRTDVLEEYCLKLRGDVDLATELAIRDIHEHRDTLIQAIYDYEAKTKQSMPIINDENTKRFFESTCQTMRSYVDEYEIEEEISENSEFAIAFRKEVCLERRKLNSYIFNGEIICFEKNNKTREISYLGQIQVKSLLSKLKLSQLSIWQC